MSIAKQLSLSFDTLKCDLKFFEASSHSGTNSHCLLLNLIRCGLLHCGIA